MSPAQSVYDILTTYTIPRDDVPVKLLWWNLRSCPSRSLYGVPTFTFTFSLSASLSRPCDLFAPGLYKRARGNRGIKRRPFFYYLFARRIGIVLIIYHVAAAGTCTVEIIIISGTRLLLVLGRSAGTVVVDGFNNCSESLTTSPRSSSRVSRRN